MMISARLLSPVGLFPLLLGIAASAWIALPASAQCIPRWSEEFPGGDLEGGSPQVLAVLDQDGPGPNPPALFAGGWFTEAGGSAARVAKWDGAKWTPIVLPIASTVYALAAFDDDGPGPNPHALFIAGAFQGFIGKWDGSTFSFLDGGTDGHVYSLAVFDDDGPGPHLPALFAGGVFTNAGGVAANRVAKWDGTTWTSLAGGVGSPVRAMTVFDPDNAGPAPSELVVGGDFAAADGGVALHVARWNGASWSALGNGADASVRALHVFDADGGGPGAPALYAGGDFLSAGGNPADRIARWNGASWSAVGTGVNDVVDSVSSFDPDGSGPAAASLFVGGDFTVAGGVLANHVARWNGSSWAALAEGLHYVPELNDPNTSPHVYAMAPFDPDGNGPSAPALYVGGIFTSAADEIARNIATWDGSTWSALGNGMNDIIMASTVFDDDGPGPHPPALIVGGGFTSAGGRSANRIAMWDGTSWSNLRDGMDSFVRTLTVYDGDGPGGSPPTLYAGGSFSAAGGPANGIATWNGSSWEPLSTGIYGPVLCMTVFDGDGSGPNEPELFVGGGFSSAGSTNASNIARWDGSSWSDVGGGIGGGSMPVVRAMAVFDADGAGSGPAALYVAGSFATAGGVAAPSIARWNGTSWSALPAGPAGEGIYVLAVHDEDGPGPGFPALFAGGKFDTVGGVSASNIARWNGTSWSNLRFGVDHRVRAMAVFDADGLGPELPELYVGGEFNFAGGIQSPRIARWTGSQWFGLSTGIGPAFNYGVWALAVYDADGSGPNPTSLYAGGNFGTAGGFSSHRIARRQGCGSPIGGFCAGDGSIAACPCGNSGGAGRGCQNSSGSGGALLSATGNVALTGDTLQLTSSGELASSLSIFLQGVTANPPVVFGDGIRCVGTNLKRLYTKGASGGVAIAPSGVEPTVSMRSAERGDPLVSGALRHYQTYYRDANPTFCPAPAGSTFNISNGISAVWGP